MTLNPASLWEKSRVAGEELQVSGTPMLEEKRYVAQIYLAALSRVEGQAAEAARSLGLERLAARIAADRAEVEARSAELAVADDDDDADKAA